MYGKDMIFKMSYLMTYECNLSELCKEYCGQQPTYADDINFKLPGVMVVFVHETIRVTNICHYSTIFSKINDKIESYIAKTYVSMVP